MLVVGNGILGEREKSLKSFECLIFLKWSGDQVLRVCCLMHWPSCVVACLILSNMGKILTPILVEWTVQPQLETTCDTVSQQYSELGLISHPLTSCLNIQDNISTIHRHDTIFLPSCSDSRWGKFCWLLLNGGLGERRGI